jgi:hypothetical protein
MMTIEEITECQKRFGLYEIQQGINSGSVWLTSGETGRHAMQLLKTGACFLPLESQTDYWGNRVPSRDELQSGTTGTLENSQAYWDRFFDEGTIDLSYMRDQQLSEIIMDFAESNSHSPMEIVDFLDGDYTREEVFNEIDTLQNYRLVYFDDDTGILKKWIGTV